MNPMQSLTQETGDVGQLVHVMLTQESIETENTKRAMVEIELRATKVGSVLEGILHQTHGSTHWGLNE